MGKVVLGNGLRKFVFSVIGEISTLIYSQLNIFSKDVILIPVNHNNSHWTAAAINFKKKRIESYDSMGLDRSDVYKVFCLFIDLCAFTYI